jgi:16S rRNA (uracil1498-N3)-methyltransferase
MESAQQSRRLRVPVLHDAARPRDSFRAADEQVRFLLSERPGAKPMRDLLEPAAAVVRDGGPVTLAIAIGPEGGWTDAEFAAGLGSGFAETALGANILRTETAVCAALAAVQYAFGAFRQPDKLEGPGTEVKEGTA